MATLLPVPEQQWIDTSGNPIAGGTVAFYIPETLTPKDTWQDSGQTTLNTNPVVLDAAGRALIYGSGSYRAIVRDANSNLVYDQLTADTAVGGFFWGGVSTGTPNAQIIAASSFTQQDGQQGGFIAGFSNSGAMTVNGIPLLRDSQSGPVPLSGGEVVTNNEVTITYEAARGAFHLGNPALGTMAFQSASSPTFSGATITNSTISTSTITLKQSATPTPTADGDIQWSTGDDVLVIGTGSGQKTFWPGVQYGALWGATIANNAGDATNDIDFAAGFATDSTNASMATLSAMTKQLDVGWTAGTNQGMRYSGAAITNTTYHLYAGWKAGGADPDWYADPSASEATVLSHWQAESGGSAYAYVRRVGSIVRSGGAIRAFRQTGSLFTWSVIASDVNATNPGALAITSTLTVPAGIVVTAILNAGIAGSDNGASRYLLITALTQADTTPSGTAFTVEYVNGANVGIASSGQANVVTNTSGQVRYRMSGTNAATVVNILTVGWIDERGRLG